MEEGNVISVWGLLRRLFWIVLAIVLILPLLLVAELVCIPRVVLNWLWDLGGKLIGGSVD